MAESSLSFRFSSDFLVSEGWDNPQSVGFAPRVSKAVFEVESDTTTALCDVDTDDVNRKERLMMMTFRRWGQFYLAMSNEALRKRTRERNQARSQVRANDGVRHPHR